MGQAHRLAESLFSAVPDPTNPTQSARSSWNSQKHVIAIAGHGLQQGECDIGIPCLGMAKQKAVQVHPKTGCCSEAFAIFCSVRCMLSFVWLFCPNSGAFAYRSKPRTPEPFHSEVHFEEPLITTLPHNLPHSTSQYYKVTLMVTVMVTSLKALR